MKALDSASPVGCGPVSSTKRCRVACFLRVYLSTLALRNRRVEMVVPCNFGRDVDADDHAHLRGPLDWGCERRVLRTGCEGSVAFAASASAINFEK